MKPLLNVARTDEELREKQAELEKIQKQYEAEVVLRKELEDKFTKLMEEKNDLFTTLQRVSMVFTVWYHVTA